MLTNVKQLQCDCQYSWLQKTLTDISNLKIQEILCSNGDHLIHLERDRLNCTKFDCGDCVCRRVAKSTTAYCSSGSTHTIPVVEDLSHLYAAFNHIKSFNASLFSDTLVVSIFATFLQNVLLFVRLCSHDKKLSTTTISYSFLCSIPILIFKVHA